MPKCQGITNCNCTHNRDDPTCRSCSEYGNQSTANEDRWIGMFFTSGGPLSDCVANERGCELGCQPCRQTEMIAEFLRPGGQRWLKPHEPFDPELAAVAPNRMANGMVGPLRSQGHENNIAGRDPTSVRRFHGKMTYQRGVCHQNTYEGEAFGDGREFGANACDCEAEPSQTPPNCGNSSTSGQPVPGAFQDQFFYDNILNLSDNGIWCREANTSLDPDALGSEVVRVNTGPGTLYQVVVLRDTPCGGNMLLPCTLAAQVGGECCEYGALAEAQDIEPETIREFDWIGIDLRNITLGAGVGNVGFYGDRGAIVMKARALQALADLPGDIAQNPGAKVFDQLDRHPGSAHLWSREYFPDTSAGCNGLPTIPGFEIDAHLRQAGVPVRVEAYISRATVFASVVAQMVNTAPPQQVLGHHQDKIFAHVRIRVEVELSYRAFVVGEEQPKIVEEWHEPDDPDFGKETVLRIVNVDDVDHPEHGSCKFSPVIAVSPGEDGTVPEGQEPTSFNQPDEIVFAVQDDPEHPQPWSARQFSMPNRAEWWGFLGTAGVRSPRVPYDAVGDKSACCRLLHALDALQVRGWPSLHEAFPGADRGPYRGRFRLNFLSGKVCA